MRVLTGTSGFGYDAWRGPFYPPDLPAGAMLGHYATRLACVEINNTFYRMPRAPVVAEWRRQVPESFRFAVKAPRRITYGLRLAGAGEALRQLAAALAHFGPTLGPVLFQVPQYVRADPTLLADFLAAMPTGLTPAFEFAHASWGCDAVRDVLAARGAALVANDEATAGPPPLHATARFGYLRLRRPDYDDAAMDALAAAVRAAPWDTVYAFFKHEDAGAGPRLAARFADRFGPESA